MEFVCIFEDLNCLLTIKEDNEKLNEFDKIFDNWTDLEYLHNFFSIYQKDLNRPIWEDISIEQAVIETRKEAIRFREYLRKIAKKPANERISFLIKLFKPLSNNQIVLSFLEKKKAYGSRDKTWLRIYALKAGDDTYIITGGAIKLTHRMNEREHTSNELKKLEKCKQFIIDEGIVDDEGLIELLEI